MSSYQISNSAASDLDEIVRFTLERWGPLQAAHYLEQMESLFELLAVRPRLGRVVRQVSGGYRRLEHESHVVFYRLEQDGLVISRVLHKNKLLKKRDLIQER